MQLQIAQAQDNFYVFHVYKLNCISGLYFLLIHKTLNPYEKQTGLLTKVTSATSADIIQFLFSAHLNSSLRYSTVYAALT